MNRGFLTVTKERLKSDPAACVIFAAFAAFEIFSGIWFAAHAEARNAALSFAYLLILPAALLAEWLLRIRFPALFHLLLFVLAAGGVLGSCYDLYTVLPSFDELLHGISGILFCAVGFTLFRRILGGTGAKKPFLPVCWRACCSALPLPSCGKCSSTPPTPLRASICRKI